MSLPPVSMKFVDEPISIHCIFIWSSKNSGLNQAADSQSNASESVLVLADCGGTKGSIQPLKVRQMDH